jgi:outer membrane PBP1 activator LpoA protein
MTMTIFAKGSQVRMDVINGLIGGRPRRVTHEYRVVEDDGRNLIVSPLERPEVELLVARDFFRAVAP